ncbi:MAG: DISARM system phospholipase D-like protein DrmC [Pseudanabaena sp. CAN_BIN31]|nr:DISARM system phospholipase D-like protein DrmC [Pseudanabaena sp. CAN_BIN31]
MYNQIFVDALKGLAIALPDRLLPELIKIMAIIPDGKADYWKYLLSQKVTSQELRDRIYQFVGLWQELHPEVTAAALHLALLATLQMGRELQKAYEVQPIWTMPNETGEWNRQTEPTILELIHQTHEELLLISFAVYDIPEIVAAIAKALARQVTITMIVEMPERSEKIPFGILQTFPPEMIEQLQIYYWAVGRRPVNSKGKYGSLHIKGVISDRHRVLISSANLTQYALNLNLELGLLTDQAKLAKQIHKTFDVLIRDRILIPFR